MSNAAFDRMCELMTKDENLHPNMRAYITSGPLGRMLNHPLVQEIHYTEKMNAVYNERYRLKQEMLTQYIAQKKWASIIFIHERPYRLDALREYAQQMTDVEYWQNVGLAWTDSENIWQNFSEWRDLWEAKRPAKDAVMSDEEHAVLAALPDVITVYRGVQGMGNNRKWSRIGLSWTLDREKAEWFSQRYRGTNPTVLVGKVKKQDVHAYFNGRNESEIVTTGVKRA